MCVAVDNFIRGGGVQNTNPKSSRESFSRSCRLSFYVHPKHCSRKFPKLATYHPLCAHVELTISNLKASDFHFAVLPDCQIAAIMKSTLFIITSILVAAANAESANRIVGHHQDLQDEEGLRQVVEQRGAKLCDANLNQQMPGNNAYHRACILTESMSMSAPIFKAKASLSMPARFVVPAEFSMSIPDTTPAAMEEEGADEGPIEEPVKMFAKSGKTG